MSKQEIDIYYYSYLDTYKYENRLNYVTLSSSNINNSYSTSRSYDIYNENGIFEGNLVTDSVYYNYTKPVNNINYIRNINMTILTGKGSLTFSYSRTSAPSPGDRIVLTPTYKTNYYYDKDITCVIEGLNHPDLIRKISIIYN